MKKYECRILMINVYHQTESGDDEILLKRGKKKIWPERAKYIKMEDASIKVNYAIGIGELGERLELELWEYDHIIRSHSIGKFILNINEAGGPYTTDLTRDPGTFAKYSLVWEVMRKRHE
jgi:hypothetical protein